MISEGAKKSELGHPSIHHIYWRIESLHQRTLIRILYEFLNEFWLNIFDHEEFCVLISIKVNVYLKKLEKRMHKEKVRKNNA